MHKTSPVGEVNCKLGPLSIVGFTKRSSGLNCKLVGLLQRQGIPHKSSPVPVYEVVHIINY
jgi:hypothetical protein